MEAGLRPQRMRTCRDHKYVALTANLRHCAGVPERFSLSFASRGARDLFSSDNPSRWLPRRERAHATAETTSDSRSVNLITGRRLSEMEVTRLWYEMDGRYVDSDEKRFERVKSELHLSLNLAASWHC